MSNNMFPRGSEWRKWDLHVHSPASEGYVGTYAKLLQQIRNSDCAVVGINDYFTVDGYKKIRDELKDIKEKMLLPVVEMRMNNVLANRAREDSGVRINFHIIFNPLREEGNVDLVPAIEVFVKSLNYKKASGQDGKIGDIYNNKTALLNDVTVDFDNVLHELNRLEELSNNYLILLPYDEYGGIDGIVSKNFPFKPALINSAHIIGSANSKEITYFLGATKEYYEHFEKRKPCIKGSDSHNANYPIGALKDKNSKPIEKYCWIKADPTFEGLKQIVREPEDRVYIGQTPPILEFIQKNTTKYIDNIEIHKNENSKISDLWFDSKIDLNTGLVAIIGNKGKGKSALIETIGLMGYTKNSEDFSFLHKNKFNRNKLADNFKATIKWKNNKTYSHSLNYKPELGEPERVKCIPQYYLERVCNNIDKSFQEEVDNVIFSHIDISEKLNANNLKQLVEYRTKTIDDAIEMERDKIVKLNTAIIELEEKDKPAYKNKINQELELRSSELIALVKQKPGKPKHPKQDEKIVEKQKVCLENIERINKVIEAINKKIDKNKKSQLAINSDLEEVKIIEGKINALKNTYKAIIEDIGESFERQLKNKFEDVVKLDLTNSMLLIKNKLKELEGLKSSLKCEVEGETSKSEKKVGLLEQLKNEIESKTNEQKKLNEPTKMYQESLDKYKDWETLLTSKKKEIGEIRKNVDYVKNVLRKDIEGVVDRRNNSIKEIFNKYEEKIKVYKDLYRPVINFISKEKVKNERMELDFSPGILMDNGFVDNLLSFVDQGRKGYFQGVEKGRERLIEIIQKYDFNKCENVISFLDEINGAIRNNSDIGEQLVKGKSKGSLYAFMFLLRFLKIDYQLRWGDKTLEDLSPGERGTVLLIFYLLIDQSNIPLVIDQPEENLDNESVYYLLVKYIKDAKKRRQIIIVTHNPNLAVVCDAEQVVYCDLDKKNKFKASYITGGIENKIIKEKIINILEGTKYAFGNRQQKYEIINYNS
ncbi:MAG: hypothetical protein LHV68_05225 [Elusimicrobia bacterium]|nr:hypothetical protein [Candidatus Liberimonas magnetica]